ncbi:MAG: aldo/keto reductase [Planctomycetota bacterium]|jgi:predicted aldo/keto reductase-like oxidoreductase
MADENSRISRRQLFTRTSQVAVAGALAGTSISCHNESPSAQRVSQVINHHPEMKYRPMGKTGMMVSEVSLGGHWKRRDGGRVWQLDQFGGKEEVPKDVAKNRTEVISACIDAGINYLDITTAAEALAYGVALKDRREKMIVGSDDHHIGLRIKDNHSVKLQTHNINENLRWLQTDYLDIWRVQAKMDGTTPDHVFEMAIEAADKAKKAGKIKHFGVSSHSRTWLMHVIKKYPQIEMIIFPCTAKTKKAGAPVTKENIVERAGWRDAKDFGTTIFDMVRKHNLGLVTIKPFSGGNLFKRKAKFPVMGVGHKEENDLARLTLQCILTKYEEITCTVPGFTTVYEVDNGVRASYQRNLTMSPADRQWLEEVTEEQMAQLPPEYQWLREWDVV